MEEEIRKAAIVDYVKGEPPKEIYTRLNRSKKWFFKWLKRYRTGNAEWYKEESRARKSQARETPREQKELILAARKRLEEERFAQVGSSAIKWELQKMGAPFPSDRTINRILKREGLTKKKHHTFPRESNIPTSPSRRASTRFTRPISSALGISRGTGDSIPST